MIHIWTSRYGETDGLGAEFIYFGRMLGDFFRKHQLLSSLQEITIYFVFPLDNPLDNSWLEKEKEWFEMLPAVQFSKKRTEVTVTKPFLGKDNSKKITIENVFFELAEVFKLLKTKKKSADDFQTEKILELLPVFQEDFSENREALQQRYKEIYRQEAIARARADREERQQNQLPAKRLIRDIRLMYHFENQDIPKLYFAPYGRDFCDKICLKLREKKFRLPNYDHLYISVAENFDNGLQHAQRAENWFVYGVAVLENPEIYEQKSEQEKRKIVFELIKTGLLDIAQIDNLDVATLNEALDEASKILKIS